MNEAHKNCTHTANDSWLCSRTGVVTIGALGILGFLIYAGHATHLLGLVPYLFLLACPLMHIFMHGGHGKHNHHHDNKNHNQHTHGCCEGSHNDKKLADRDTDTVQGEK